MRMLFRLMAALSIMVSALAMPAMAEDGASARMKRVMPYMDRFVSAPEEERSLLRLVYRIKSRSQPEEDIRAWYMLNGTRVDLDLNVRGELKELPSLETWRSNPTVQTNVPRNDVRLSLRVRPNVEHSTEMPAQPLAESLVQAKEGIRRVSGLFGMFRPKVKGYRVEVPDVNDTTTSEIVYADGTVKQMTVEHINPLLSFVNIDADELEGATMVRFSTVPTEIKYRDK